MKTILVIDDAPTVRQQIVNLLEEEGYTVLEASNGLEAVAHVKKEKNISFILCDYNMPGMNGFEFFEELAKLDISIPGMMLTTEVAKEYMKKGKELGLKGWIVKPFNPDGLKFALKKFLE